MNINTSLSKKELEVMKIFWKSGKSCTASEIAAKSNISISTVHTAINKLLEKNMIVVAEIVYSGKVLCRSYEPTLSAQKYDMQKLIQSFKGLIHTDISTSKFVSALLGQEDNDEKLLEELDELEQLIKEKKAELKEKS